MNTTVRTKASEIYKDWHVIDAAGKPLGRVATEAAILLRGKHKPTYEPHLDDGDFVIIVNAQQVKITGKKSEQKKYYTHSGYPGGLKTRSYAVQLEKHADRVIEKAVWGMLPGGSLGEKMLKHLKVYRGPRHPHQSQIAGSESARATRAALLADTIIAPYKPARLRPLSVPQVDAVDDIGRPDEPIVEIPTQVIEAAPKPARARRGAAAEAPAATEVAEAAEAVVEPVAEAAAAVEDAPAAPVAAEVVVESATASTEEAPASEASEAEAPKRTPRRRAAAPKSED